MLQFITDHNICLLQFICVFVKKKNAKRSCLKAPEKLVDEELYVFI